MSDEPDMMTLLDFRHRFDACMAEVGYGPAIMMSLSSNGWLTIMGRSTEGWDEASIQALRISAQGWPPAVEMIARIDEQT